jgi:hypothetical protein
MLVTGAGVPLINRDRLSGPGNVVGIIGHAVSSGFGTAPSPTGEERAAQIAASLHRYKDRFVCQGDRWLFAERQLILDWTDTRTSNA